MSYLLITLVGFIILLYSVSTIVESYLVQQRIGEQQQSVSQVSWEILSPMRSGEASVLYHSTVEYSQKLSGRVLITDTNGVVQVDALSVLNGYALDYSELASVLWEGNSSSYGYHQRTVSPEEGAGAFVRLWYSVFPKKEWDVYYTNAIIDEHGTLYGAVVLSASIQDVKNSVASIRSQVLLVLVLVGCAILVVTSFLSNSITRPITELTRVIRRMSRGEFNLRVKVSGKTEVDELGRTFNDMSERLENIEQFRNEFVSNASHEIKTPLATMKILIESLLYQPTFDENVTKDFLSDVNKEIDRLNLVISDLLRLVQFDQMEDRLQPQSVRLDQLCEEAIKRIEPIARKKNIILESKLLPFSAVGDPVKLEQVFFNIVDNAVKYTDQNGTVKVCLRPDGEYALIEIEDNGIGIPQKDLPHIFDRFYRVDKARSRDTGGTGLGLSIVDKIVKMHGGRIEVTSVEGEGTTFHIYLPPEPPKEQQT